MLVLKLIHVSKRGPRRALDKHKHYLRRDNKANENQGIDIIAIKVK